MIPTNLVDRMKVVSDFDTLILRHMMIEMGVQSLCRPSGAASEILTMFEETFRQDREAQPNHVNGHVPRGRGRTALPEPESAETTEAKSGYDKKQANKAWLKAALARKQDDPWRLGEWRREILRWAAEHGWVFDVEKFREQYESQNKRKLTDTYCKTTIGDMQNRQHFLKRTGKGKYAVTEAGKRVAESMDLTASKPTQTQPEKKAEAKPVVTKRRIDRYAGDPHDTQQWRKEFLSYAVKHNGEFSMAEYGKQFKSTHNVTLGNTKIYATLFNIVEKGLATKPRDGIYRLTPAGRRAAAELGIKTSAVPQKTALVKKAAPTKKAPAPAKKATPARKLSRPASQGPVKPDDLLEYAAKHDGNIFTKDFIKEYKTSVGSTYTNLARLQADKRVEKVAQGHFRVLGVIPEAVTEPATQAESATA